MKKISVKITREEFNKIKKFAIESMDYHWNPNNRKDTQILDNIVNGKLAEFAFYKLYKYKLKNQPNLEVTTKSDPGYDFMTITNKRVDVKSQSNTKGAYFNLTSNNTNKTDFYYLFLNTKYDIINELFTADSLGYVSSKNLSENLKPSNYHGYFAYLNKLNWLDL